MTYSSAPQSFDVQVSQVYKLTVSAEFGDTCASSLVVFGDPKLTGRNGVAPVPTAS